MKLLRLTKGTLIVFVLCLPYLMTGCGGPMKQGKKYFEGGLYDSAVRQFEEAARKKPNEAQVQIWLKKSREKAAESHYAKAMSAEESEDWPRATSEYRKVLSFVPAYKDAAKRVKNVESADAFAHYQQGVAYQEAKKWDSAISEFEEAIKLVDNFKDTNQQIQETKEAAAEEQYQAALSFESNAQWVEALVAYEKATQYVVRYKEVAAKIENAKTELAEIAYQEASQLMGEAQESRSVRQYRKALAGWERCLRYQKSYKDALALSEKAKKGAVISVCIMPFEGTGTEAARLTQKLLASALSQKPELMSFVDRQYLTNFLVGERNLAGLGAIDAKNAVQVGKLAGVHAFVAGQVFFTSSESTPQSTMKKIQHPVKATAYRDGRTIQINDWRDFTYKIWEKSRTVELQVSYQIINAIDGRIVDANTVSFSKEDTARWMGDLSSTESTSDLVEGWRESVVQYETKQEKFTTSKEPQPQEALINEAISTAAHQLASTVIAKAEALVE